MVEASRKFDVVVKRRTRSVDGVIKDRAIIRRLMDLMKVAWDRGGS